MWQRGAAVVLTVVLAVGALGVVQALAQPAEGQRDPDQMRQRIEQFRQQMSQRMRESLKASDEEWKVLEPLIDRVQTLSRQARGGFGGMMGFGRGGRGDRGGPPGGPTEQPQTDVDKAAAELRAVLATEKPTPEQIKPALLRLRNARAKVGAELEAARKELAEVVTVHQEAQLVMMGILE